MLDSPFSKTDQRRQLLLKALSERGAMTIPEMMELAGCSKATIVRDLDLLAGRGLIIRTINGAQPQSSPGPSGQELSFQEKKHLQSAEKMAIARRAVSLVEEGDVVGLTGGTTTFLIAWLLRSRVNITVVTNAVNIAASLAESEGVQVVVTGGVMRGKSYELCGPLALKTLEELHIGKMFLGVDGVSLENGLTTHSEFEAQTNRLFIAHAQQTYAVFDHTKWERTSLFPIAPLSSANALITDKPPSAAMLDRLRAENIPVYVAKP
ncbi:GntR family transcriptional regulator [Paenibacillus cisolokensis]|uniref:GntR family transcriptional regulator n=1 Tax=Paenibacillus cisolokensis TaxID=1658519 RepID=A0ABQ4N727_9BACL|nr:DeoR/GlpR family DNA-binding transcription regulator [Paenibacillus cisolokensis]GIQ63989.1 GntR family transcriptional regulator [Paenibacillus cisolokensis]